MLRVTNTPVRPTPALKAKQMIILNFKERSSRRIQHTTNKSQDGFNKTLERNTLLYEEKHTLQINNELRDLFICLNYLYSNNHKVEVLT